MTLIREFSFFVSNSIFWPNSIYIELDKNIEFGLFGNIELDKNIEFGQPSGQSSIQGHFKEVKTYNQV